uniref:Uncharacterized protein n=1 Tax=Cyclophora tenuis TaxID=216820 RepID=A0A7S1D5Y4_CYCTE
MRKDMDDSNTQVAGLTMLCNICHDRRSRKEIVSSGASEVCMEALKKHATHQEVQVWALRLREWTSGRSRSKFAGASGQKNTTAEDKIPEQTKNN